jgi:hypothetical protein
LVYQVFGGDVSMYRNSFAHKNMKTKLKIAEKYSISFMGQSVQQQQK